MSWGQGIGIGWPNSTSGSGVNTFEIKDCNGTLMTVYSIYPDFLPGAIMFIDSDLTEPFTEGGKWNLIGLIDTIGGYNLNDIGEIKEGLDVC